MIHQLLKTKLKYFPPRYSGNTFFCVDTAGELAACANNCPGVDPNAIVVGGAALATAAIVGSAGILQPFFLLGGLGAMVRECHDDFTQNQLSRR